MDESLAPVDISFTDAGKLLETPHAKITRQPNQTKLVISINYLTELLVAAGYVVELETAGEVFDDANGQ